MFDHLVGNGKSASTPQPYEQTNVTNAANAIDAFAFMAYLAFLSSFTMRSALASFFPFDL